MNLHISKDIEELSNYVAEWLVKYMQDVLSKKDRFTIALSGGSTPQRLYQLLASEKYRDRINWKQLHFFWGDERCVSFSDDRNNAKKAFDSLLSHVPVAKESIHFIQTDIDPVSSAIKYEKLLLQYFQQQLYTFDFVLLGLGDNAHTLSLFPGYDDIIFEKENWVRSFYLKEQQMYRITLTAPVINKAARIAFLINGNDKSNALRHVISGIYDPVVYPAQLIQPLNGELYWLMDQSAASGLQYAV